MPTQKPRMQISLRQDVYDFYMRYGELQGMPGSSFVTQHLTDAMPHLQALALAMAELKQADLASMTQEQRYDLAIRLQAGVNDSVSNLADAVQDSAGSFRAVAGEAASPKRSRASPKVAKSPPHSLIHRNKPSNPLPTRVPAGSAVKKGGRRASST